MRWADLDQLGHVNNVVYADYLQEARVDMLRTILGQDRSDLAEGVVVVRHEVTYVAPMTFRFRAVTVESWVTEIRAGTFTLAYEVFHGDPETDGGRRIYLRATSVLTPYVFADERPRRLSPEEKGLLEQYRDEPVLEPKASIEAVRRHRALHFSVWTRFSDVDVYRHVNNVKYFEYLQESRIRLIADVTRGHDVERPGFVVAQTDVDYLAPITLRREPYDLWSEVVRVGSRSMTVESEIADGERRLARARVVVVFFDVTSGRSTDPDPAMRALLEIRARSV